ncbi:MAG: YihY/virulence factor BrkB family protein [Nocardioidaceae bacterium]
MTAGDAPAEGKRPGLVDRAKQRLASARAASPLLDHLLTMLSHYGDVRGGMLAGGVTYFGFLSFFPVLAIAFAVVGYVTGVYPQAQSRVTVALASVFPGLIGTGQGQIDVSKFSDVAAAAGIIGAVGLLYAGLGWLSALRQALQDVFEVPRSGQPNLLVGKVTDLLVLVLLGVVLLVSVAVSASVAGLTKRVEDWLGMTGVAGIGVVIVVVGALVGVLASTALFYVMYRVLAQPDLPRSALLRGALLAAVGFEVLKLIASKLLSSASSNPAYAAVTTAIVLLVWINYFSRVTLYGAAWAATSEPRSGAPAVAESPVSPVAVRAAPPATRNTAAGWSRAWRPVAVIAVAAVLARGWLRRQRATADQPGLLVRRE